MSTRTQASVRGFTILEASVVMLIIGLIAAFSTPKIVQAMREYRVAAAARGMVDQIQKAKMQAVGTNSTVALQVDTANRRMGVVVVDNTGTVIRTDWVPLPQNVTFSQPSGVTAPVTGAPTATAVSFPAKSGQTNVYEQTFSSRGFPVVATGAINAIYFGNGTVYRAVTLNSVGGIGTWKWQNSAWVTTRTAN